MLAEDGGRAMREGMGASAVWLEVSQLLIFRIMTTNHDRLQGLRDKPIGMSMRQFVDWVN